MSKNSVGMLLLGILFIAGCATTGPSRQVSIDSLNGRITALEGQLAEKDAEIARMRGEIKEEARTRKAAEAALARAEEERRSLLLNKRAEVPQSDLK